MPSDTLIEWVDHHARSTPAVAALSDGSHHISYGELRRLACSFAARARQATQAQHPLICIYQDRALSNLVAMIGTLWANGTYTVLETGINPEYALKRLREIGPDLIVTDRALLPGLAAPGAPVITCDGLEDQVSDGPPPACTNDIAYVLFTSGSTGTPKGVMVKHSNIRHYTSSLYHYLGIAEPLRYAHVSSLAADLGNTSIFLALYSGGTLFLVPDRCRKDPAAFFELVEAHGLNFLKMTPSHWLALAGASRGAGRRPPRLRYLLLGGEILSVGTAADILASGVTDNLFNHYGPTETTVGVVAHRVSEADLNGEHASIPIGSPFGETRALVLDAESKPVDTGFGELYIGGPSVSAGYLNAPTQTAASFVSVPRESGVFYRTGDKVFRSQAGLLFCHGRVDRQVKIGGYRVELDHVEAELAALPEVAACAVESVQIGSSATMVAAITLAPDARRRDAQGISEALTIPHYMRPRLYRFYQRLPLNKNGKVDRKAIKDDFLQQLAQPQGEVTPGTSEAHDPLMRDIRGAWTKYLRFTDYDAQDSLFSVGGDSLTAIQIISELQVKGYAITIQGFLDNPTMNALYQRIATAGQQGHELPTVRTRRLSSAQQEFFRHDFADGNRWSQALLLECLTPVDAARLAQALTFLSRSHPLLRTAYKRVAQGVEVIEQPASDVEGTYFFHHQAPAMDDDAYQAMVLALSARLQDLLDIERGNVFQACLISSPGHADHLLLIIHHLAIDAVSWRIVIDDIVRAYEGLLRGERPRDIGREDGFWRWTQHLLDAEEVLRRDLAFWPAPSTHAAKRELAPGLEHQSQTCWSYFTEQECTAIANNVVRPKATSMDAVILAAFALACQDVLEDGPVDIAVESYGRAVLDHRIDVSRTVGWFTSTFPLAATEQRLPFADMLERVEQRIKRAPHLGVAHGMLHGAASQAPRVSYNYLGHFDLMHGENLRFAHARYHPGSVRGRNRRQYDLTLTVKLLGGATVLDCNFSSPAIPIARVEELLHALRARLLGQAGMEPVPVPCLVQPGTSSGLLTYTPSALLPVATRLREKAFSAVLLTGATGFIGCHLLERLLASTRSVIYCVVRADNDDHASRRLAESVHWYFPHAAWSQWAERVKVLAGDVAQDDFGLSRVDYAELVGRVEAVYHLAADTRLLGGKHEYFKNNVSGVENVIRFARQCGDAEIHYMSTLAVAGVNKEAQAKVFSEAELDIGQEFINNYEASKFETERRLNEYRVLGGKVWTYRAGNVTADSRTARFQRNAQDNRFIQTIMALVRNGEYSAQSEDTIVLSPVDVVAAGIVALSLSGDLAPGAYHVDSSDQVSYNDIYRSLRDLGLLRRAVSAPTLDKILLANQDVQDKLVALGRFWAQRPHRNVIYNHAKTTALLAEKGIYFPKLDRRWLYTFFDNLDCVKLASSNTSAAVAGADLRHMGT